MPGLDISTRGGPSEPMTETRFLVAAAMKDEGPFILEWVCWYRMLGFELLIVTNDCSDHSVDLLQVLVKAGWIRHAEHAPREGEPPKKSAHRAIQTHPGVADADWLLICDVDEFLVLREDLSIADYVARFDPAPLGIGFHWKCFGTSDEIDWRDGLTHRIFQHAAPRESKVNGSFKSLFRDNAAFEEFGAHAPKRYSGEWGVDGKIWVDCRGKALNRFHPTTNPQRATAPARVQHKLAQMNHYVLRSAESFALKQGRPSASAGKDRYTQDFFDRFNRNDEFDTNALLFRAAFDAVYASALALPDALRLHHLCCADYVARLADKQGRAAQDDPRFLYHRHAAGIE